MKQYILAKLGAGKATHSLMPNGKTHCWQYFKDDPYNMDDIKPTGEKGRPDCTFCQRVLGLIH
jgi:hypothetical protein